MSLHVIGRDLLPVLRHEAVAAWRPATPADIGGICRLRCAMSRADHPNYHTARESIARDFAYSYFDPQLDSLVGLDRRGRIVACGMVMLRSERATVVRSLPIGGVHPELRGRGIGRQLLGWQLARARQQLAGNAEGRPGRISISADAREPQSARLFTRAGFRLARTFLSMERSLVHPIPSIRQPGTVRLAPYASTMSDAVHAARDMAFRDHWNGQPMGDENWAAFVGSPIFRADLSFVAIGTDQQGVESVAGLVLATVDRQVWRQQGFSGSHVELVAVTRRWRGMHLATLLLCTHLRASRALGYERCTLEVDAENPTGALTLYVGMGFAPTNSAQVFTMEFDLTGS